MPSRLKLSTWSRRKMHKSYRRNNIVLSHLPILVQKVVSPHSPTTVVLYRSRFTWEVHFHLSLEAYLSEAFFIFMDAVIWSYMYRQLIWRTELCQANFCLVSRKKKEKGSSWANKLSNLVNTQMSEHVPAWPQCQSDVWEHDVVTARMLHCAVAASVALTFPLLFFSCQAELWPKCWG